MVLEIFMVSVIGAFLSLDRTAVLQSMIARPIITAPVIGYALGDIAMGVAIGAAIELLWICALPVGAYVPPDENMTATLVTATAVLGKGALNAKIPFIIGNDYSFIAFNILLIVPLAYIGRVVDRWIREKNNRLSHSADEEAEKMNFYKVEAKNILGLITFFVVNLLVIFALILLSTALAPFIYTALPSFVRGGMALIYPVMIIVGIASIILGNKEKNSIVIFAVSFMIFSLIFELV